MDLRYSLNNVHTNHSLHYIANSTFEPFDSIGKPLRLATSIAMFSLKLKKSNYFPDKSWLSIKRLAQSSIDETNHLQKEFIKLIDLATKIYGNKRKTQND